VLPEALNFSLKSTEPTGQRGNWLTTMEGSEFLLRCAQ
jgi:hypothetical protein